MKNLFLVLIGIAFVGLGYSQETTRIPIQGKILVEGNDIEGITIVNKQTSEVAVSDRLGTFRIDVKINDTLHVRALEYNSLNVVVNNDMLDSKEVRIYLIEKVNELDEIVLTNRKLTGNISLDAKNTKLFNPRLDAVYYAMDRDQSIEPSLENIAMSNQGAGLTNGLNLKNIVDQLLIPLFRSEANDKKNLGIPEVPPKSIKYYFGATFISENFNIPEYRVEEFIRYVEDENFDYDLLNYGRELEFLEVLREKSVLFLQQ